MTANTWDAIVIGSGLGGLTAAAAYAQTGKRVLILERLANFGGAATVYRHGSLTMEASLHETDGDTVFGPHGVFSRLGLQSALRPISTESFYAVRGGPFATPILVPHSLSAARAALKSALPRSGPAFDRWFDEMETLHEALGGLESLGAHGPAALLPLIVHGGALELFRAARRTLQEGLDRVFSGDEAAQCAIGAPIGYFDDDPGALSFLLFAGVWSRYVESGSYYFRGGSLALTTALVAATQTNGGQARRRSEVRSVRLDAANRAVGVTYTDEAGVAHDAFAPVIFVGIAPSALVAMAPEGARARLNERYHGFAPSTSLFCVSLGLSRPASECGVSAFSTFVYPSDFQRFADYPKAAERFSEAPRGAIPPYTLADYGRLDTGLARPGDLHLVNITGADRLAWWEKCDEKTEMSRRSQWIDALIADANRHFPGLAAAVVQKEIATARTMKNRLGTPAGEVYGFRPTPERLFARPPRAAMGVPGLFAASAFTVSGGYSGAMQGGLMAADAAAKYIRARERHSA